MCVAHLLDGPVAVATARRLLAERPDVAQRLGAARATVPQPREVAVEPARPVPTT